MERLRLVNKISFWMTLWLKKIWHSEGFPIQGKSKSKWLAYNMAMRARIFDNWTTQKLQQASDALVLHIGCGLDSRCKRVKQAYKMWIDCDLPEVIAARKAYYTEEAHYQMKALDITDVAQLEQIPSQETVIVILEGISMYIANDKLYEFFQALEEKYSTIHILMDSYTAFGAKVSSYKHPVHDIGSVEFHGIDDIEHFLHGLAINYRRDYSLTPLDLVNELKFFDRIFFKLMFTGRLYRKIYRLVELGT